MFDTSICQSVSYTLTIKHSALKTVDGPGLCLYVSESDPVLRVVLILILWFIFEYVCVYTTYTCVWGIHDSFFGISYKHDIQKMYKPWIY